MRPIIIRGVPPSVGEIVRHSLRRMGYVDIRMVARRSFAASPMLLVAMPEGRPTGPAIYANYSHLTPIDARVWLNVRAGQ